MTDTPTRNSPKRASKRLSKATRGKAGGRSPCIAHKPPPHLCKRSIPNHPTSRRYHGRFSHDLTSSFSGFACIFGCISLCALRFLIILRTLPTLYNTAALSPCLASSKACVAIYSRFVAAGFLVVQHRWLRITYPKSSILISCASYSHAANRIMCTRPWRGVRQC